MHQNKYCDVKTLERSNGADLKKKMIFVFALIAIPIITFAYPFTFEKCNLGYTHVHHKHNEASYQQAWCSTKGGIEEYQNKDYTRVDCLTDTHAVEFDFANKWAESIGQALHYGLMTGKKPKVVLILDNPKTQKVYFKRVKELSKKYKFDVEYVTDEILTLDKEGKCSNINCKCHKRNDIHQNQMQQYIYNGVKGSSE